MNIQIKITNESNAKELNININSMLEIDLEDYVFCCVAGEISNAIYDACCAQADRGDYGQRHPALSVRIPGGAA